MTDRDQFAAAALTGLLVHANDGIDEETLDTPSDIAYTAYAMADAMLRERAKTNHDAAPAAIANAESVAPQPTAGDRAGNPPSHSGTGDTPDSPKPISGCVSDSSKPINGPTPVHTPPAHATRGEGSEPREGTQEPVAWGVADGSRVLATSISRMDAVDMQGDYAYHTEIVPLYREPTLTDEESDDLRMWFAECMDQSTAATDGANEELSARWLLRAHRAAVMLDRLGGER